jgi:GNAT superfamily N-acetyltransferase
MKWDRSSEILVRVAAIGDAAAIERVLLASYPALMAGAYDEALLSRALPAMTRANPKLLSAGTYYLVLIADEPVGCGGWTPDEPGTGRLEAGTAHIRHFGVDASRAGRGIGRHLYERCRVDAAKAGVRRFECFSSLNGVAFYRALGFEEIEAIAVPMGPGLLFPSVRMEVAVERWSGRMLT